MLDQSEESNEEIRVSSADAAMLFNGQNSGNSKPRPSETPGAGLCAWGCATRESCLSAVEG